MAIFLYMIHLDGCILAWKGKPFTNALKKVTIHDINNAEFGMRN